jgi:2'-5' RNA ligase
MRRTPCALLSREFFPIKRRIQDRRLVPFIREHVEVTSRQRKVTETFMDTGATRQSEPPEWSKRAKPTHFLSLRVPSKCSFQAAYAQILREIAFSNETYSQLFVKPDRLHVTASVFTINDDEQLSAAVDAAKAAAATLPRLQLRFEGIGTFSSGRVLFAKVVADKDHLLLTDAVLRIRRDAAAAGVDTKGNPLDSYVPHVTLAKVRPHQAKQFPSKVIPINVWAPFKHDVFGTVSFASLDVCCMSGTEPDGYYKTVASFPLQ